MPTYEYACKSCGEHLEVVQSFKDDALTTCPACGGDLRKVFGSIGIAFKGSGFYKTDSRSAASGANGKSASSSEKSGSSESSGSPDKTGSTGKTGSTDRAGSSDKGGSPEKTASSQKSSDKPASSTSSAAAS
jgi:putative FmdB family regulatory protein